MDPFSSPIPPFVAAVHAFPSLYNALWHWVSWNEWLAQVADFGFRYEDANLFQVFQAADVEHELGNSAILRAQVHLKEHALHAANPLSWDALFDVDEVCSRLSSVSLHPLTHLWC